MTERRPLDGEILVGDKPMGVYLGASAVSLMSKPSILIKGRGRYTSRAIDLSQIIQRRMPDIKVGTISISSEVFTNKENRQVNVSSIEIKMGRENGKKEL